MCGHPIITEATNETTFTQPAADQLTVVCSCACPGVSTALVFKDGGYPGDHIQEAITVYLNGRAHFLAGYEAAMDTIRSFAVKHLPTANGREG
jgi:hypothetical protein